MAVQMVQQSETQRWERALARALDDGLDVLIEPVSGEAFVESATTPGVLYAVGATFCSCPGGALGAPCKHRACYLAQIGELPTEPVTVVPVSALGRRRADVAWADGSDAILREIEADARAFESDVVECVDCAGCGVVVYRSHEARCDICGGSGRIAA